MSTGRQVTREKLTGIARERQVANYPDVAPLASSNMASPEEEFPGKAQAHPSSGIFQRAT